MITPLRPCASIHPAQIAMVGPLIRQRMFRDPCRATLPPCARNARAPLHTHIAESGGNWLESPTTTLTALEAFQPVRGVYRFLASIHLTPSRFLLEMLFQPWLPHSNTERDDSNHFSTQTT